MAIAPTRTAYGTEAAYQAALARYNLTKSAVVNTGARDAAGNLLEGQSNQSPLVTGAATSRAATLLGQNTPAQQQELRSGMEKTAFQTSPTINKFGPTTPEGIAAQKDINLKFGLPQGTGLYGEGGLAQKPQATRDLVAEKKVIDKYGPPTTKEEATNYYAQTYEPQKLANLIESGQISTDIYSPEQLAELGLTPERLQHLVDSGRMRPELLENLKKIGGQANIAAANSAATPKPTNEMMNILAEALNQKSNYKEQPLGTSELFKQAGLSGYAVLAQNMAQRGIEMDNKRLSAASLVTATGQRMASIYDKLSAERQRLQEMFDKQLDRLLAIDEASKKFEEAKDLAALQSDLDLQKSIKYYQYQLDHQQKNYELKEVTRPDGSKGYFYFDSSTGEMRVVLDADGNPLFGDGFNNDEQNGDPANYPTLGENEYLLGDKIVSKEIYDTILGVGSTGDWCGVYASKYSTGHKVGDSWASKKSNMDVTAKDIALGKYTPKLGDKLLIPIGVKSGKGWGHVALVTGYNPQTGEIYVTESNRDGRQTDSVKGPKGVVTAGKYNIKDLMNGKYGGTDWGLVKGELKNTIANKITGAIESFGRVPGHSGQEENWLKSYAEMGITGLLPNKGVEDTSQVPGTPFVQTGGTGSDQSYKQYGKLADTTFNPKSQTDLDARNYLDQYLKSKPGALPTVFGVIGARTDAASKRFTAAMARANQIYFEATGESLPDLYTFTARKKLLSDNLKLLNANKVVADTVERNFNLAIEGEISNDINVNQQILNDLVNPLRMMFGDPSDPQVQATFAALVSNGTITQEFANLIATRNAQGTTVSDKEAAAEILPFGTPVQAQKAVVERLQAEAKNIRGALEDQISSLWIQIDPLEVSPENPNRKMRSEGASGETVTLKNPETGVTYTWSKGDPEIQKALSAGWTQ